MCKLTGAFSHTFFLSHRFNSKLQISWSILSRSHSKSPSSILHNFSRPLSLQIHCEIAFSVHQITVTAVNVQQQPCALNMHLERWPPAAISRSLCLPAAQTTQLFSLFMSHCLFQTREKTETGPSCTPQEVTLYLTLTQSLVSFHVPLK